MPRKKPESFESLLEQTEKLVDELESGELSLDESLKRYTRGVQNLRACEKLITQAEAKVKALVDEGETRGFDELPDFAEEDG